MPFKHLLLLITPTLINAAPVMLEHAKRRLSDGGASGGLFEGLSGVLGGILLIYAVVCFVIKPTDQAYCMRCKEKVLFKAEEHTATIMGVPQTKGTCPTCAGGVCTTTKADGTYNVNDKPSRCECFFASLFSPRRYWSAAC